MFLVKEFEALVPAELIGLDEATVCCRLLLVGFVDLCLSLKQGNKLTAGHTNVRLRT